MSKSDGAVVSADYLIQGGGAVGMAFADQLFSDTDATMVIVDPAGRSRYSLPLEILVKSQTPCNDAKSIFRRMGASAECESSSATCCGVGEWDPEQDVRQRGPSEAATIDSDNPEMKRLGC